MTTAATPALLRIRAVAALVLHHAGYRSEQIADSLGATTVRAEPAAVTPELLTAAGQYLRDSGFTYWGIPEALTKLRASLVPEPTPPTEPEPQAWERGQLFDLATG